VLSETVLVLVIDGCLSCGDADRGSRRVAVTCGPMGRIAILDRVEYEYEHEKTPTIRQCHHCHCEEFKTWTLLHPLIIHWMLNPGLAVNELFFGQRIPRTVFLCRNSGSWLKPDSQFIECPKCKRFHSAMIWRQCGFGNWLGLVCPDCGASIPSVLNLTSFLILAILSPVLLPLSLWLRTPYRHWAQRRIAKSRLYVQSQSGTQQNPATKRPVGGDLL
jgi:hypothetical protein